LSGVIPIPQWRERNLSVDLAGLRAKTEERFLTPMEPGFGMTTPLAGLRAKTEERFLTPMEPGFGMTAP